MEIAELPKNELERLSALLKFDILDTDFENEYDELVKLASYICGTPIALISLIDSNRQWFKAKVGLKVRETSRDVAFCSHALEMDDILVVNDTFDDHRFIDNPLVTDDPNIRFYAGAQLRTKEGFALGTLCAIDRKPRYLNDDQLQSLKTLAKQVVTRLELKKSYTELKKYTNYLNNLNQHKDKLFRIISHDLRSPFNSILGFSEILKEDIDQLKKEEIKEISSNIEETATNTFELVNNLLTWSLTQSEDFERKREKVELETLFNKVLSVLGGLLTKKKITIYKNIADGSIIYSDYDILFSAIQNIMTNSIKFSPIGGNIKIDIRSNKEETEIRIKDSGVGLSQTEIEHLLSNNGKLSKVGTNGEKGTGLGFNISKDFIQMCEGKLTLESELNKGTEVKICFETNL